MARLQYQRAAKAGGYRPQQVDERNIARMREESNRVIDGMRQAANAEIESRREVARAMKENTAYTARAEERNFQIQTQNSNNQIQGLRQQAIADQNQAAADQKAMQSIFESISEFSSSAAGIVIGLQEQERQKNFTNDLNTIDPEGTAIDRALSTTQVRIDSQAALTGVQEAEQRGADPVVAAKVKGQIAAIQYDFTEGQIAQYYLRDYVDGRNREIKQREQEKGTPLTYEEIKQVVAEYRQKGYDLMNDQRLNSSLVKPYLKYADDADASLFTQERQQVQKEENDRRSETVRTNYLQAAPENRQAVFNTSFPHLVDIHGYPGALDIVFKDLNRMDAKGNFLVDPEEAAQLVFPTEGKSVAEKYSDKQGNPTGRYADLLSERIKLRNQFLKQQRDAQNLSNAQLEDNLVRAVMENPTTERLEEAKLAYTAVAYKESPKLAIVEKFLSIPAQQRQNTINAVSKLRDFELTPEIVAAAVEADPTKGAAIKARYDAYTAKWKTDAYKKSNKSLDTLVSGTTQFGTTKAATAGSLPMIGHLQAQLKERTALYEPTLGFEAAHQRAAGELAQEYRNGYRDKTNTFYRKVGRNGTVSYPNLPVGNVSAAEQVKRNVDALRQSVKTIGVEGVLDTPLSVTSAERLEYIKKNFYKDDFKATPEELAFIGMSKGMPLHEAYNRFFEANGDSFRLQSPLRLNGQEVTLTPEDKKVLGDPTKGPQAKLAVINRILNPGMYQTAQSMRPGSPFLVYTSGNIGPTSTGPHLDVKQVGGGEFAPSALDEYIEVDDPELGVVPLSQVPITGSFAEHTARGSHGIDYGLYSGTKIYAKNGARLISTAPSEHGDVVTIQLPDGKQYTFLHGTAAK